LFYQHVLKTYPCEVCIYIRVWLAAIALISLAGLVLKRWHWSKITSLVLLTGLALGLTSEVWAILQIEYNLGHGGACSYFANFPSWAKLDHWLPAVFEVQEACAATPKVLFGLSMADGLVAVSLGFVVAFILSLISIVSAKHDAT